MSGRSKSRISCLALAWLASTAALPLAALEGDQTQPIRITAEQAERDEKKGFTRYRGNVLMNQGSLRIEADSITIFHNSETAERIIAAGKPARMEQQPDPTRGPVNAHASTIEYLQSEDRVQLRGDAYIEQDGSTVTGETIDYYIGEQRITAGSDSSREDSRVEVVIPPQQLREATEDREDDGATDGE
jgi:lipopolysaccharide export system protein LptA